MIENCPMMDMDVYLFYSCSGGHPSGPQIAPVLTLTVPHPDLPLVWASHDRWPLCGSNPDESSFSESLRLWHEGEMVAFRKVPFPR